MTDKDLGSSGQLLVECPFCGDHFRWETAPEHRTMRPRDEAGDLSEMLNTREADVGADDARLRFRASAGFEPVPPSQPPPTDLGRRRSSGSANWATNLKQSEEVVGRLCTSGHVLPADFAREARARRIRIVAVVGPPAAGKSELLRLIKDASTRPPDALRFLKIRLSRFGNLADDPAYATSRDGPGRNRLDRTRAGSRPFFGVTVSSPSMTQHLLFIDVGGEAFRDLSGRAQHVIGADVLLFAVDSSVLSAAEDLSPVGRQDLSFTTNLAATAPPSDLLAAAAGLYGTTIGDVVAGLRAAFSSDGPGGYLPQPALLVFTKGDRVKDQLPNWTYPSEPVVSGILHLEDLDVAGLYLLAAALGSPLTQACDLIVTNFLTVGACLTSATGADVELGRLPARRSTAEADTAPDDEHEMPTESSFYPATAQRFGELVVWLHLLDLCGFLRSGAGLDGAVESGHADKDAIRLAVGRILERVSPVSR